jgi:methionine sulfoxide reductase heme-binding subunit
MRLSARAWIVLGAALGILIVVATNQIVPATSAYQAQTRIWLAGRATGITAYLLLTALVSFGLILSHPTNQSTWKLSKRLFPWHENLFVFVVAFLVAHIVSIILDPYAGVGVAGSFIPGLSAYRSAPVALGTLGLYAALVSGITGRWTKLLPRGLWLKLHRFALVAWVMSWMHGILAGTDSAALLPMYLGTGLVVLGAGAYRYWVAKKARPTFATSLLDAEAPGAPRQLHPRAVDGSWAASPRPARMPDGMSTFATPVVAPLEDSTR